MVRYTEKQIYETLHELVDQTLGRTDVLKTDLTNIADVGREIFDTQNVYAYVNKLIAHIGKVVVTNRTYGSTAPSVMMDGWEFGSVLEKIDIGLPYSVQSEVYQLKDGASYDPNVFHAPKIRAKFFQDGAVYDHEMSYPTDQVQKSFSNAIQMGAFLAGIENSIRKAKTIDYDNLIMGTINYSTGLTIASAFPDKVGASANFSDVTHVKAVNLLKLYNDKFGANLTPANCLDNTEFEKFATKTIGMYIDRLKRPSVLFNESADKDFVKFTPEEYLHTILLSDFAKAADVYLQASTFHNELTKLPEYEVVPYWQGEGTNYDFSSTSNIHVNIKDDNDREIEVNISGVIGVMFDRDRLAVCNQRDVVDTNFNPKARFYNYFYHSYAQRFIDSNENCVVFFVA